VPSKPGLNNWDSSNGTHQGSTLKGVQGPGSRVPGIERPFGPEHPFDEHPFGPASRVMSSRPRSCGAACTVVMSSCPVLTG